ncbi:hypothetical protein D3C81_1473770 [compost metagenome]
MPSHLFRAMTMARPASRAKPSRFRSWSTTPSRASMTKITTLASLIACRVLTTENFSTSSWILPRLRTPAVSIRVYFSSLRSKGM